MKKIYKKYTKVRSSDEDIYLIYFKTITSTKIEPIIYVFPQDCDIKKNKPQDTTNMMILADSDILEVINSWINSYKHICIDVQCGSMNGKEDITITFVECRLLKYINVLSRRFSIYIHNSTQRSFIEYIMTNTKIINPIEIGICIIKPGYSLSFLQKLCFDFYFFGGLLCVQYMAIYRNCMIEKNCDDIFEADSNIFFCRDIKKISKYIMYHKNKYICHTICILQKFIQSKKSIDIICKYYESSFPKIYTFPHEPYLNMF